MLVISIVRLPDFLSAPRLGLGLMRRVGIIRTASARAPNQGIIMITESKTIRAAAGVRGFLCGLLRERILMVRASLRTPDWEVVSPHITNLLPGRMCLRFRVAWGSARGRTFKTISGVLSFPTPNKSRFVTGTSPVADRQPFRAIHVGRQIDLPPSDPPRREPCRHGSFEPPPLGTTRTG